MSKDNIGVVIFILMIGPITILSLSWITIEIFIVTLKSFRRAKRVFFETELLRKMRIGALAYLQDKEKK